MTAPMQLAAAQNKAGPEIPGNTRRTQKERHLRDTVHRGVEHFSRVGCNAKTPGDCSIQGITDRAEREHAARTDSHETDGDEGPAAASWKTREAHERTSRMNCLMADAEANQRAPHPQAKLHDETAQEYPERPRDVKRSERGTPWRREMKTKMNSPETSRPPMPRSGPTVIHMLFIDIC